MSPFPRSPESFSIRTLKKRLRPAYCLLLAVLCVLPLVFLLPVFAFAVGAARMEIVGSWEQQPRAHTLALLRQGRYEQLDVWLSTGQARYESGQLDDMELWRAFSTFWMIDESALRTVLDEWVSRRPDSYVARVAHGYYFVGAGWRARGGEYAAKTPAHRFARMRDFFNKARTEFEVALTLAAKPTIASAALIDIAGAESNRTCAEALLMQAISFDHRAQTPRYEYMNYLRPKWGGSYAAMERFAQAVRGELDEKHARILAGMILSDQAGEAELVAKGDSQNDPRQLESAMMLVDQAIALGPDHAAFMTQKASLLGKLGRKTEALEWFERSIALSDAPDHHLKRGIILAELGRHAEAVADFRYAADLGNGSAQQRLGWGYRMGDYSLQKNPAEALKWFRRVAEWGDNYSQYMVGDLIREGAGGKPDFAEVAKWYRLAAEDGYAVAQGSLGVLYWNGMGVERNRWEAMRWWRLAAAQGDANAKRNIEHLLNPLDRLWMWFSGTVLESLQQLFGDLSSLFQVFANKR